MRRFGTGSGLPQSHSPDLEMLPHAVVSERTPKLPRLGFHLPIFLCYNAGAFLHYASAYPPSSQGRKRGRQAVDH